jgi:hypothetical protein
VAVRGHDDGRGRREATAGLHALRAARRADRAHRGRPDRAGRVGARPRAGAGCGARAEARGLFEHRRTRLPALHEVPLSIRGGGGDPAGRDRGGDHAHHAPPPGPEAAVRGQAVAVRARDRVRIVKMDAEGGQ